MNKIKQWSQSRTYKIYTTYCPNIIFIALYWIGQSAREAVIFRILATLLLSLIRRKTEATFLKSKF